MLYLCGGNTASHHCAAMRMRTFSCLVQHAESAGDRLAVLLQL
jgi:hypothetical protein